MIKKLKVEKLPKMQTGSDAEKKTDLALERGQLAVDVFQTDKEFIVRALIAGIEPKNIEVLIDDEMLIIKGQRREEERVQKQDYFYQECFWGSFERQIILPEDIDKNKMKATLGKGILILRAPRVKKQRKQKINVQDLDD